MKTRTRLLEAMKPPEAGTPIPLVPPTQATEERAQAKEIGEHASRPREGHLGKKEAYRMAHGNRESGSPLVGYRHACVLTTSKHPSITKDTTISQVSKTKKGVGL